jgi:hypothetical protein
VGITSDGRNLWFTEFQANQIGEITIGGVVTETPVRTQKSGLYAITADFLGDLWFTETKAGQVGTLSARDGIVTEFPNVSGPAITAGPGGNFWIAQPPNEIGQLSPFGALAKFVTPTPMSVPAGITTGPDGNIWFTEQLANQIGLITPDGTFTELPIPTANSYPNGITPGPSGTLWFAEYGSNKIGEIFFVRPTLRLVLNPAIQAVIDSAVGLVTKDTMLSFNGTADPGATVAVYAQGTHALITQTRIGTAVADAQGNWTLRSDLTLAADRYQITAQSTNPLDGMTSPLVSLTAPGQALVIETAAPVVANVVYQPRAAQITVTFQDPVGLDPKSLSNQAFYIVSGPGANRAIAVAGIAVTTSGGTSTVTLTLAFPKRRPRPAKVTLRIKSGGIENLAGSALDGAFSNKLPSGIGQAGNDFVALLPLKLRVPKQPRRK